MKNVDFSEVIDFLEGPGVRNWQFTDSGIKLINIRNLVNDKINLENTTNHLSEEEVSKKYNHFLLKEGDYIMASSGVTWGKIAEVKKEHLPLCLNTSIIKLRPKYDDFEKKYLWYFIKSNIFTKQIDKIITGSAQPNFGPSHLKKVKIPLPPLPQQQKIANILDAVDALRQNDKALIAKFDELTQSLFLDMFGDPVSNPKGWKKLKLGLVTNMKAGKFISASEIYSKIDEELYSCYGGGNGLRGFVKSHTHEGEFVLIGRQGALCGNVKVANGKFHATEHAIVCSPKMEYKTIWLYHLLDMINLNKYSTGAAQPGLNVGTLIDLDVIFTPFELQTQFAERIAKIEQQKSLAQASLQKSEELFNSLLQKAFKGELV
jgi:type I restriction enzyme S subunit